MADGQDLLKQGKYYDAAARFQSAATLDPSNPLARIGTGVALLAAGEQVGAASEFRKAMQVYPPIVAVRVNLTAMLPERPQRSSIRE